MTTKNTKKTSRISGRKAHNNNRIVKVGRIYFGSWASRYLKSRNVYIFESELVHIMNRHRAELAKIGMTPLDFVIYILRSFNEIRKGKDNSVLLVVKRTRTSNMAAVSLTKIPLEKKEVYKVNTASMISTSELHNKKLLCANDR